ncbi:MAG: lysophospholipid acyltransferase family protein [Pseudomonadota bacterium]
MKDRIDDLIFERAPWLDGRTATTRTARRILNQMLGYDRTVSLAEALRDDSAAVIMRRMGEMLAKQVHVTGLGHLPATGPALVVANHPTGIADGIILYHMIAKRRPDVYAMANKDILRLLPQMEDMICPVEWRLEKRTHASARETMHYVRKAKDDGRIGLIFPSGRLAKRRGLNLKERPWMSSAAMLARKFDLPVVPVNIQARNSLLFYLFDLIHPTLRDITLFHETLNKDQQPFRITVGAPIPGGDLPRNADEGIAHLKQQTLDLGRRNAPTQLRFPLADNLVTWS